MLGNRFILAAPIVLAAIAAGALLAAAAPDASRGNILLAADDAPTPQTPADAIQRKRAEDLAREASERFSDILSKEGAKKTEREAAAKREQAQVENGAKDALAPVWDWLARASERYEDVIVAKLRSPSGEIAIETQPGAVAQALPEVTAPRQQAPELSPRLTWGSLVESVREWLARANRSYRTEIVKELKSPPAPEAAAGGEPVPAAQEKAAASAPAGVPVVPPVAEAPAAPAPAEPAVEAPVRKSMATAAADAKRAAQEDEAKRRAEAEAKQKAKAEADRLAEQKRKEEAEAKRKAEAEEKRVAEEKRKAEAEAKRKAEAEAKRAADEKRKAEAEEKRIAEEKRRAQAEAIRKAEVEARRVADEKRKAEAEAKRIAEEKRQAEARREAEAEEKRVAEEKRKADEAAKRAAEAAAAKRQVAEADAKRLAEESEAEHKAVAEAKAKRMVAVPGSSAQTSPPIRKPAGGDRGEGTDKGAPAEPKSAAPGAPKAREETVVAEAPPPKAEKGRSGVRKIGRAKKRAHTYRRKRYAAAAPVSRRAHALAGYRMRKHVHRQHRHYRLHVHRGRRGCAKVYGYRRRQWGQQGQLYVVRRGDTLSGLARRRYGRSGHYGRIYRANRGRIRNANLIYPGQHLYIP